MKRRLRWFAVLLCAVVCVQLGYSCAYGPDEDVFTQHKDPDPPYAKYAAGRLGIVAGSFRIRHLVVAYNTLGGRALSSAEQTAAVAVDKRYDPYGAESGAPSQVGNLPSSEPQLWPADAEANERKVPGQDWESFANCLSDAFSNAVATLSDRRARYRKPGAPDTPEIDDWIAGQQAVFSNCSGPGQTPTPAPANAPLWLRQDRAYQTAAAQFYALDYDQALAGFRAIAADRSSPWSPVARYLVARVYIRKALIPHTFAAKPELAKGENARVIELLTQARHQLEGILQDPSMNPLHGQTLRLLDFVMLRLDPMEQANELARRLTAASAPDYQQNIIDLTYIYNSLPGYTPWLDSSDAQARLAVHPPGPLVRWLNDFGWPMPQVRGQASAADLSARRADALNNWRSTHGAEWLVAALTLSQPGQDGNAGLMAAARDLPSTSAAYASATYARLRLAAFSSTPVEQISPTTRPTYDQLSELMPHLTESQPLSTLNQFADLHSSLSPTLSDYLVNATRRAVGMVDPVSNNVVPFAAPNPSISLCGVDIHAPETRHLDDETALIFNQRMPLRMLKEAVLSSALPGNVRFQLAHMAWTRALLLDDAETARALSPYLEGCQPAFGTWLNRYDAAQSAEERHVLGLLALMRFTSTEPTVRAGRERDFAVYDETRDNWWCSFNAMQLNTGSQEDRQPHLFAAAMVSRTVQPDPPFLSDAERRQADKEIALLKKIPNASDYFALQALAWVKDHPTDPHNSDLVGFAMRVVRNACRSDNTKDLDHELFDLLHRRYADSEWATRYKTWE